MLPRSPRDFLLSITALESHKVQANSKAHEPHIDTLQRAIDISQKWDIDAELWDREWANLSGGEAQRMALAIAVSLNTAEVILLDGAFPAYKLSMRDQDPLYEQNRLLHWILNHLRQSKSSWWKSFARLIPS